MVEFVLEVIKLGPFVPNHLIDSTLVGSVIHQISVALEIRVSNRSVKNVSV